MTWHIVPLVWILAGIVYGLALIVATGGREGRGAFWFAVVLLAFVVMVLTVMGEFG